LVLDNFATGFKENLNKKSIFSMFDIRNNWNDLPLLQDFKPDIIYHIAALARIQPSFNRPYETLDVNAQGTVRALEYAKNKICKFVYSGSSSFYFDPHVNPYAHSKWIGEEHCKMYNKTYGVPIAIARFFNVYGKRHVQQGDNANVLGIFEYQKSNSLPITITGNGEQRRDFTNIEDICDGLISMGKGSWNADIFNLGRSYNYSINEVAKMFNPKEIIYVPSRIGEATYTLADISFSKEKLNWEPKHNLPDYIEGFLKNIKN
jgi:UDP-glucose 4-epimerase